MTRNLRPVGLDRLETALDTYGADRTRWPAPLRHELSALIAGDAAARKLLRDAELFDQLLDHAPQYDAARLDNLKQRIENATGQQPRLVASRPGMSLPTVLRRFHGVAATALAASLVLGVVAGQSSIVNSIWNSNSNTASTSRQIAQTDDTDVLLYEDML